MGDKSENARKLVKAIIVKLETMQNPEDHLPELSRAFDLIKLI